MQLALDKDSNDLILSSTGIERIDKGRYTVQLVRCKLLTALREWRLDPRIGWVGREDFEKNFDRFDLEIRAKKLVLNTKGVQTIDTMNLVFTNRKLVLTFTATTIYGLIELTVPWG